MTTTSIGSNNPFHNRTTSSASTHAQQNFNPTTTPVGGQPLLHKGRVLIYPPGWQGCHKCQNTGYKQFDPSHPCRKCWERYGKSWSSPLAYATNLENQSQILQRPLPASGSNFIPPTMSSHGSYSGHHAGNYQVPPNWQSPYQAPSGPPPPPPARPGPPRVNRASTADEAVDDPSGEAPPAYDDAINNEHPLPPQQTGTSSTSSAQTTASSPPIPARPSQTQVQPPSHPPYRPPPEEPQQWYGQGLGQGQHHFGAPPVMHRPLVVQPGDPRIGGQLCYKCGGQGMRSSFWLGDETCYVCNGSGRVFPFRI